MFIESLIQLVNGHSTPSPQRVKDLIYDINSWNPDRKALEGLSLWNMLPVEGTDGQITLSKVTDTFAIVDRVNFGDLFKNKVPLLNFELEEVHGLRPFLSALSLGGRYISQLVKEFTTVNGCNFDRTLSGEMREKAYALFRLGIL